ncbi:MAG: sugar ABC transporter permease [Chloroflexi bacterium]|nr:sugar ABC transporter permease [Chloroflexota bacterium]MBI3734151.1 sugar ABC transporter permease [Chloroflexota bacterium]
MGEWLNREDVLGYLLLLPVLTILGVFVAYPFVYGVWLAFTDTTIVHAGKFTGLDNLQRLLDDSIFQQAASNSFIYTGVTTVFKLALGLAMAAVLNIRFRGNRFVRAATLLPWIIPTVLSTLAWKWMFDASFSVFNYVLASVGILGPTWLGVWPWPMVSIIVVNIWRGMPFYGISFLAGMQTIPQELYEAATIDGASAWSRFMHITLPLLRPVITVVLLLSTILTFADFQIVYVLTGGGPANLTHLFATYSFQIGLRGLEIGVGAAISLFMFPILAIVVFLTLWTLRKEQ